MASVPPYGTPEWYIYQAVKEQKNQMSATSSGKSVVSWSTPKVEIPDTSKYFQLAVETFTKNKASYDAMFPTRKPATSSKSSSSSPEAKKTEKPESKGNVDLVKFEYTAEQKGQIETELTIIENELKKLEENAPKYGDKKYEGKTEDYRKDADAYNTKKAILQDAKKAFGFMTTTQKGKEESIAELDRILTKDYNTHKEALRKYFDLADGTKDDKLTEDNQARFGALTSATVDIIPEKDDYKKLEDAFNSTPVTSTPVTSTPGISTSAETTADVLKDIKQKEQFNKVIKDFNSRGKSLPSLMFDEQKLAEEAKFVEDLLSKFGDNPSISNDQGQTLEKKEVEAYQQKIKNIQDFAKEEVKNKPADILKSLEKAGDKDEDKLAILDKLSDKEVLMLLKDYSQEVVRNFFSQDNMDDDTASYTYLLTRMTAISERLGDEVPSNLSSLKDSKYNGGDTKTSMAYEDKKYESLPNSVKEGSVGNDKQIVWMQTIDSLTEKFKTEKEIEATKRKTEAQKPKVFEFYVDRINNVDKNNPDAVKIINESEERIKKIAIDKGDGQYLCAGTQSNIQKTEIEKIKNKIKYTLTDARIKELLKPYRKDKKEDGAFKEKQSCDRINDGLSLEEAIALVAQNHDFVEEMVSNWGVSSTDELGIVYNRVRDKLSELGYEGVLPQEYVDRGNEEYQHRQFGVLKRILKDIGCIPENY